MQIPIWPHALGIALVIISCNARAIDCSNLDRKSDAYQTCMLRQENQAREIRNRVEAESDRQARTRAEGKNSRSQEFKRQTNYYDLLDIQIDVIGLGRYYADNNLGPNGPNQEEKCLDQKNDTLGYYLTMCPRSGLASFVALNSSPLVQEITRKSGDRPFDSFVIAGIDILHKPNVKMTIHSNKRGIFIDLGLRTSKEIINDVIRAVSIHPSIDVFIRSGERSTKLSMERDLLAGD
jgi:hypothetical protein